MARVKVRIFAAETEELLKGRNGPVTRHIARQTGKVYYKAVATAPVATGELKRKIRRGVEMSTRGAEGRVTSPVHYSVWVHEGTRRHKIRARRKQYLRWRDRATGGYVFAKEVQHPGTKPNKWLEKALHEAV